MAFGGDLFLGLSEKPRHMGVGRSVFFFFDPPPNSTNEACFCCVVKQRNKPWGCFGLYLGEYREYTIHLAHGLRGLQSPIAICICINCHDMDPVGKTHGRQHFFSARELHTEGIRTFCSLEPKPYKAFVLP